MPMTSCRPARCKVSRPSGRCRPDDTGTPDRASASCRVRRRSGHRRTSRSPCRETPRRRSRRGSPGSSRMSTRAPAGCRRGSRTRMPKQPGRCSSPRTVDADSCARSPIQFVRCRAGRELVRRAELFLDNRAGATLPGGSRLASCTSGARHKHRAALVARCSGASVACDVSYATPGLRPTTLVGLIAGALTLCSGGKVQCRRGALEFYGGLSLWLADAIGFGAMTLGHVDHRPRPLDASLLAAITNRPTCARSSAGAPRSSRRTSSPVSWHGGAGGITIATTGSSAMPAAQLASSIDSVPLSDPSFRDFAPRNQTLDAPSRPRRASLHRQRARSRHRDRHVRRPDRAVRLGRGPVRDERSDQPGRHGGPGRGRGRLDRDGTGRLPRRQERRRALRQREAPRGARSR